MKLISPVINFTGYEGGLAQIMEEASLYIMPSVLIVIGSLMLLLTLIEFIRIKKKQKIQKPFVKTIIVLIAIFSLFLGQLMTIIYTESLNNYAEERNLISIYREEKKFEREVNKEGKLGGNTDSINSQIKNQVKILNMLDQNERAKKSSKKLVQINNLHDDEEIIETTQHSVLPKNEYINQNSKPLSEVNFQNEFSKNDEGFLNSIEIKEYTLQYKNIKSRLEKYKEEGIKKSDNITIEGKKLIEDKYNEKVEKLNHIVDLLKWGSEFKLEKINFDLLINLKSDDSIILNMANDFEEPVIKFDNVSELKQYTNTDSEPEIDMILNKNNIFEGNFQLDNEAKIEKNILEFEKENQTIFEIKKTLQETTEELNNIKLQKKLISNNSEIKDEIKDDLNLVEKFEKLDEIVNKVVVQNNSSKTKDKEPKDILKINIDLKAPLVEKLDKLEEIMNNVRNELIYRDKENFDYLLKETILEDIQEELLKYINGQKFVVPSVTQITNEVYPYINMGVKKEIIDKSIEQGNCVHEMISLSIDQRNNSSIKLTQNDCENKIHIQLANRIVTEINSLIYKFKIKKIYSENTFINFERPNYIGTPDILMDDVSVAKKADINDGVVDIRQTLKQPELPKPKPPVDPIIVNNKIPPVVARVQVDAPIINIIEPKQQAPVVEVKIENVIESTPIIKMTPIKAAPLMEKIDNSV
ncbi:hypothetical protein FQR65_LT19733 [Abscondita terminalis]|nr:hypothetical protein FQR65_LT19733 [Abscondita terminalis]